MKIQFYDFKYNNIYYWLKSLEENNVNDIIFFLYYIDETKSTAKLLIKANKIKQDKFYKIVYRMKLTGDASYDTKMILLKYEKLKIQLEFDE